MKKIKCKLCLTKFEPYSKSSKYCSSLCWMIMASVSLKVICNKKKNKFVPIEQVIQQESIRYKSKYLNNN